MSQKHTENIRKIEKNEEKHTKFEKNTQKL